MNFVLLFVLFLGVITRVYCSPSLISLTSPDNQIYIPSTKSRKRYNIDIILVLNNLANKTIPAEVTKTIRAAQRRLEGILDKDIPQSFNYTKPCRNDPLFALKNTTIVDDLLIFILPYNTSGFANGGPCFMSKDGYARVGSVGMGFNAFDAWRTPPFTDQNLDFFRDVLLHEFLHVLGIGTLWWPNVTPYKAGQKMNYTGANGVANYRNYLRGSGELEVETDFGSRGDHFDECQFDDELMSPVISYDSKISTLTCSALQDLKYQVNMSRCDTEWTLPRKVPCTTDGFRLFNTIFETDLHNDTLNDVVIQ
jgi:hypothetical protein